MGSAIPLWQRGITLLLWVLVGVAKTMALLLLLTDADARWPDALLLLVTAWALVGVAMLWRSRTA